MSSNNKIKHNSKWEADGMAPNLIHAVNVGDYEEAKAALEQNPDCISELGEHFSVNALQLAMLNLQEDIGLLLIEQTEISTTYEDFFGRDSLDIALTMFNNSPLCDAVWERWNEQMTEAELSGVNEKIYEKGGRSYRKPIIGPDLKY